MPFGFHQIGFRVQAETAVNLLSDETERSSGREIELSEHIGEKTLKPQPTFLRAQARYFHQPSDQRLSGCLRQYYLSGCARGLRRLAKALQKGGIEKLGNPERHARKQVQARSVSSSTALARRWNAIG